MRVREYLGLRPDQRAPKTMPWWWSVVSTLLMVAVIRGLEAVAAPSWLVWPLGVVALLAALLMFSWRHRRKG